MEELTTAKPQAGSWATMTTSQGVDYPESLTFEINIPLKVIFKSDEPREVPNKDRSGVFYVFDVADEAGNPKQIATSAWTLLHALKALGDLKGKTVQITKKMNKGKQFYEASLLV